MVTVFVSILALVVLLGAGCASPSPKNDQSTSANQSNLRQLTPPAPPVSDPVIPPEAKNIPRPY